MNTYVTGSIIKKLREEKNLTQVQLAQKLSVSDKAVSKWETGRGYPDITLIEPMAQVLGVSVIELLSGETVTNANKSFNMKRLKFYICPVCGNVLTATGEAVISCCGVKLVPEETEEADKSHTINIEMVEDEYYVWLSHEMTKNHYISFLAAVTDNSVTVTKLYPEQPAEARFKINRTHGIYAYCNKDGLFSVKITKRKQHI